MTDPFQPASRQPDSMRTVTDVLRRGFDNAVANWQLLLLRFGETVAIGIIVLGGVVVTVLPLIGMVAAGSAVRGIGPLLRSIRRGEVDPSDVEGIADSLRSSLLGNWWILLYVLLVVSLLLLVLVAIHSFVVAGAARVFVDGERAAGSSAQRPAFAAFSIERWMAGGRENWWAVFWIYNIAYTILAAIIIVPLLLVLALMLLFRGSQISIAIACLGVLMTFMLLIVLSVLTSVWCQKAIVIAALRHTDGWSALREARSAIGRDFGRHLAVVLILVAITFGGSGALSMFSIVFALPGAASAMMAFLLIPVRLAFSFMSGILSAAVANWLIASFAALSAPWS